MVLETVAISPKRNPSVTPVCKLKRLPSLEAVCLLVPMTGIELVTFALRMRCSTN